MRAQLETKFESEMCKFQNILFLCSFFGVCICDVTKSNMMETPQTQMTGGKIRITTSRWVLHGKGRREAERRKKEFF